jgi:hypothetical protein
MALQALLWMALVLARVKTLCLPLNSGGGKKQLPFYRAMSCSHIFSENVLRNFNYLEAAFGALLCVV